MVKGGAISASHPIAAAAMPSVIQRLSEPSKATPRSYQRRRRSRIGLTGLRTGSRFEPGTANS
jgi:hypothetical protein